MNQVLSHPHHHLRSTLKSVMAHFTQNARSRDRTCLPRFSSLDSASVSTSPLRGRRWRTEGDISGAIHTFSFRDDVGHAAAETYLITKLAFTLLKFLGVGYRWLTKFGALACYAMFLMPGFIQVGYYYFFDKRIHRSIVYGSNPRNRLDLYLPENCDSPKPIVVFVTGGAWIIGYKAWGSLLGLQLVDKDIIVACLDYRNFPQGCVSDMVEDVMQGISFICENIAAYNGDPNRLYLVGQSAGAHLAACALVEQAIKELGVDQVVNPMQVQRELVWTPSQFKAYFGISGGYNLPKLVDHFHNRGLYRKLFLSIMEGEGSLLRHSPEVRVRSLSTNARSLLPAIVLLHGTADASIPFEASANFADVLESLGVHITLKFYEGKTHTDVFLQDPMRGGHDVLLQDILDIIRADDKEGQVKDASAKPRPRLVPEILLQLARRISPF